MNEMDTCLKSLGLLDQKKTLESLGLIKEETLDYLGLKELIKNTEEAICEKKEINPEALFYFSFQEVSRKFDEWADARFKKGELEEFEKDLFYFEPLCFEDYWISKDILTEGIYSGVKDFEVKHKPARRLKAEILNHIDRFYKKYLNSQDYKKIRRFKPQESDTTKNLPPPKEYKSFKELAQKVFTQDNKLRTGIFLKDARAGGLHESLCSLVYLFLEKAKRNEDKKAREKIEEIAKRFNRHLEGTEEKEGRKLIYHLPRYNEGEKTYASTFRGKFYKTFHKRFDKIHLFKVFSDIKECQREGEYEKRKILFRIMEATENEGKTNWSMLDHGQRISDFFSKEKRK